MRSDACRASKIVLRINKLKFSEELKNAKVAQVRMVNILGIMSIHNSEISHSLNLVANTEDKDYPRDDLMRWFAGGQLNALATKATLRDTELELQKIQTALLRLKQDIDRREKEIKKLERIQKQKT